MKKFQKIKRVKVCKNLTGSARVVGTHLVITVPYERGYEARRALKMLTEVRV